jgi:hypothetical protein
MALRGASQETTGRATEEVSRPESELSAAARPMTGAEYIESICARNVLTCPTDTGNGGYTMRFFLATQLP